MFVYFQLGGCQYWYDSAAFLFSLVNNPGWKPLKLDQTGRNASSTYCSIYSCSSHGPTFGHGLDIFIANAESEAYRSYTDLGITYSPPPGNSYMDPPSQDHSWPVLTTSAPTRSKSSMKLPNEFQSS